MVSIELNYNKAYKWNSIENVYSIGYLFFDNALYKDMELTKLILSLKEEKIKKFIEKVDGCFSLVINFKNKIMIVSDVMRTFPVFYSILNNMIDIKDNIMKYENKVFNNDSIKELSYCNYVTGHETIFKNIYELEGHQIVEIAKKNYDIKRKKYFEYEYNFETKDDKELIKE